jgi:hypothetical protein
LKGLFMKQESAICIYTEFDGDFAHIKGYICNPELNSNGTPEPVDRYEHTLTNVRLHSQASKGGYWSGMYGMSVNIECYDRVTLDDAKKAVAILTPIDRKIQKMLDDEGSVKSYGQWLNRVARAIGARTVFFKREKESASRSQYHGAAGGDIVYYGDALEQKVGEWANPVAVAA